MESIIGQTMEITKTVEETDLAVTIGSGNVQVFATPMMIALMEQASAALCAKLLEDEETTVGVRIESSHVSATPVGMKVRAQATLLAVDDKKFRLEVKAFDERGLIGEGVHTRVRVKKDGFEKQAIEK